MRADEQDRTVPARQKGDLESALRRKVFAAYGGGRGAKNLPGLCLHLLTEQKKTWPNLREGYQSLKDVRERKLSCNSFSIRLQFNPGRIKSSTADAGEKDASGRRCFLCPDHLPESQKGILHRKEFLILCNPMPVFASHFTVSHGDHCIQAVDEHIGPFLQLTADFGPGWTVLYNGPKCGASAPDHLHFQVVPSGQMPIENEILEKRTRFLIRQGDGVSLYRTIGLGREVVLLQGNDPGALRGAFKRYLNALKNVLLLDEEPMINMAGLYEERTWRLMIFPRRKHRPDAFFRSGDARVVVSPGVIDMGGVLIAPLERDFQRLDAAAVEGIYREVSLEKEAAEEAIEVFSQEGF